MLDSSKVDLTETDLPAASCEGEVCDEPGSDARRYVRIAATEVYMSPEKLLPCYVAELVEICKREGVNSITRKWIGKYFTRLSCWISRHGISGGDGIDPFWIEVEKLCAQKGINLDLECRNKSPERRVAELADLVRREGWQEWSPYRVREKASSLHQDLAVTYGSPYGIRWSLVISQLPSDLTEGFHLLLQRKLFEAYPEEMDLYISSQMRFLHRRLFELLARELPFAFNPRWVEINNEVLYNSIFHFLRFAGLSWRAFVSVLGEEWSSRLTVRKDKDNPGKNDHKVEDYAKAHGVFLEDSEDNHPNDEPDDTDSTEDSEGELAGRYAKVDIPDMRDSTFSRYVGIDGEKVFVLPPDYQGYEDLVKRVGGLRDREVLAVLVNRRNALARVARECLSVD